MASFAANISAGNYGDAALDAVGVAADTVATAVPFVPGGAGTAIKAKRVADAALDLKKVKQNPCGCFAAGTLVLTPDGQKPIETLRVGDLLAAKDETTGDIDWKPITQLHIYNDRPYYELTLAAGGQAPVKLTVTTDHPFYVQGQGWTDSIDLNISDKVSKYADGSHKIMLNFLIST